MMANASDLEERARKLEEKAKTVSSSKKPILAVRLDLVKSIIDDLDSNEELKGIFGSPVSSKLALVYDSEDNTMNVAEARMVELDDMKKIRFLKIVEEIFKKNLGEQ